VSSRIWLINYEFPPLGGGAGNATRYIARELAALGHDVTVLTTAFGRLPRREEREGYTVRRVRAIRRRRNRSTPLEMISFTFSAIGTALRLARRERPDASIAFFGIPSGPVSLALKGVYGVPYIVSLRGGDVPGFQPYDLALYHRLTKPLIRFIWRCSAAVVANSAGLRDLAMNTAPELPIPIIPNGIDVDQFLPANRLNREPPPRLLFVGRLTRQKGLVYLLEALVMLDAPYALAIAGDGDQRAALETRAAELGIGDRIHFAGWCSREEIINHYAAADVFVFPSLDEGMSNAVLEAMACGLPIVATDIPGNAELVVEGKNGYLIPPRDSEALAERLQRLMLSPALREKMGRESRLSSKAYSWDKVAETYASLIQPRG
jgi:glycosyltransferase involved in cell wall biosynthesis